MVKEPLKGLVISVSGEFGPRNTVNDIKRWIANAGGRYASNVDSNTTHLICSEHNWKTKAAQGKLSSSRDHLR